MHILATSDVHGALFDQAIPQADGLDFGSLRTIASMVSSKRQAHPNCMLVDNGDFLQGAPFCDFLASKDLDPSTAHPIISAMNIMGYDAVGLGNHEFDYGLPYLEKAVAQAQFPLICSNLMSPRACWLPSVILQKKLQGTQKGQHVVNIGILSVMPQHVLKWNHLHMSKQVCARNMLHSARETAARLREAGADLVLALAHTGLGLPTAGPDSENLAILMAEHCDIDAMVCGHIHEVFPNTAVPNSPAVNATTGHIRGVPTVMPGFNASHLGEITLELRQVGAQWRVQDSQVNLHATQAQPLGGQDALSKQLDRIFQPLRTSAERASRAVVAQTDWPIHSYFACLPDDPSVALTAAAQQHFAQSLVGKQIPRDIPILSAACPYKFGGKSGPEHFTDLPIGKVQVKDLHDLQPFQNAAYALLMTGYDIRNWLEMSAGWFRHLQVQSGTSDLLAPDFPCYSFDVIFGLNYEIDLTQPAKFTRFGNRIPHNGSGVAPKKGRISNLMFDGLPLQDDQPFVLVTNSYRAGGGGNFPIPATTQTLPLPTMAIRDLIKDYLQEGSHRPDLTSAPWKFRAISGTQAKFHSSHLALDHARHWPLLTPDISRPAPQGFVEFTYDFNRTSPLAFLDHPAYIQS
ncbi:5'-nucleotidase C-terminal domain-containing protein [Cognatishimia sp. WU-CL00825]|uniref:5'-nucleotidase C-terminal domain-containing protein n=1 Tax=Cognatishimia sp. WU-CL00825 TaxID=3127658 RepID=UPI003365ACFC